MVDRPRPVLRKLLETGEQQAARLMTQLLGSERFVTAVQEIVSRTLAARQTIDRSLRTALASMNLPSTADVDELRKRLDDLDRLMTELHAKLERIESKIPERGSRKRDGA
jgi:hypothetical protein